AGRVRHLAHGPAPRRGAQRGSGDAARRRGAVVSEAQRAGAAYVLPNGLVVIAAPRDDGLPGWLLPTLLRWQRRLAPDYELDAADVVRYRGEPTGWYLRDLRPLWTEGRR